jgi:hypothetical protein
MKRIAAALVLVVGIVGMGLLAGCSDSAKAPGGAYKGTKGKGKKGGNETFVYLELQADGSCTVTEGVGTLGGKKDKKLIWHLANNCDTPQYLGFTHYQEVLDATTNPPTLGSVDPDVVNPDPNTDFYDKNPLPASATDTLEAKIKKDNNGGSSDKLFKYWICASATKLPHIIPDPPPSTITCLDPDVDIWP